MKRFVLAASMVGLLGSLLLCSHAFAGMKENLDMVDNLYVSAVKSLQVKESGGIYSLNLVVQMRNANDRDIKLSDCDFDVKLGSAKYSPRSLGKAKPKEIVLESAVSETAPSTNVDLKINLGSKQSRVLNTLAYVMNIVGDPADTPLILINGEASASIRTKQGGWVRSDSDSRMPIEDMPYHPKVQKELLLE